MCVCVCANTLPLKKVYISNQGSIPLFFQVIISIIFESPKLCLTWVNSESDASCFMSITSSRPPNRYSTALWRISIPTV